MKRLAIRYLYLLPLLILLISIIKIVIMVHTNVSLNLENLSMINRFSLNTTSGKPGSIDEYCQTIPEDGNESIRLGKSPYFRALHYFKTGDWSLSRSYFQTSTRYPLANFYIGLTHYCEGDSEKAYQTWDENLKELSVFFSLLGEFWFREGNFVKAEKWFQFALNMGDQSALTFQRVGQIIESRGDLAGALGYYRKAIEVDPNYSEPYYLAAWMNYQLGVFDQALVDARKALNLSPSTWYYRHLYGAILFMNEDIEPAKTEFEAALQLNPESCWSLLGLVEIFIKTGELDKAFEKLQIAQSSCDDTKALEYYRSLLEQAK